MGYAGRDGSAWGFSIFLRLARGRASEEPSPGNGLQAVSNAMVKLHKEQFGRGPTNARSYLAGADTLVCTLEDSLLPPSA